MRERSLPRLLILGRRTLAEVCGKVPSITVADVVASAEEAIVQASRADIILIDFAMPGAEGMDRLRRVVSAAPGVPVLVMVPDDGASVMAEAMSAGALGFVPTNASPKQISDAVQVVMAGGSYIDPSRALSMLDKVVGVKGEVNRGDEVALSKRELQILILLAEGRSARQIATRLTLSERTINTHVANIYRKLAVSNRVEAVREAIRLGLVVMPG